MEKIITRDKDGNRIVVKYESELLPEEEIKADIVIDSYQKFRLCVRRANEESQYIGGGDGRYEAALRDLIRKDHDLYNEYTKKLHEEYSRK